MKNLKTKHLAIGNQIGELAGLYREINKMALAWKIPRSIAMNIHLAVEEAVTNIIFYAFADSDRHEILVSFSLENNRLTITITDDGMPFNPLAKEQPDINLPADERPIGGLGIFLIRQIMDEANYVRKESLNILTLQKTI